MSSSVGMIIPFPTEWKNHPNVPVTTKQFKVRILFFPFGLLWPKLGALLNFGTNPRKVKPIYCWLYKSEQIQVSKWFQMCLINVRCLMVKISHFRQPKLNSAFLLVKIPKFFLGYLDCHLRPPVYCIISSFHNLHFFIRFIYPLVNKHRPWK